MLLPCALAPPPTPRLLLRLRPHPAQDESELSCDEFMEPFDSDRYLAGTRILADGWFQPCRGCNVRTAHEISIAGREEIPFCPRCKESFKKMKAGQWQGPAQEGLDPLCSWAHLPRIAPMTTAQRSAYCDHIILCKDDEWQAVKNIS